MLVLRSLASLFFVSDDVKLVSSMVVFSWVQNLRSVMRRNKLENSRKH